MINRTLKIAFIGFFLSLSATAYGQGTNSFLTQFRTARVYDIVAATTMRPSTLVGRIRSYAVPRIVVVTLKAKPQAAPAGSGPLVVDSRTIVVRTAAETLAAYINLVASTPGAFSPRTGIIISPNT